MKTGLHLLRVGIPTDSVPVDRCVGTPHASGWWAAPMMRNGTANYRGLGNATKWTQKQTCVTATTAHNFLRIQFYPDPGSPTLEIDDVDVHKSIAVDGGFEAGGMGGRFSPVRTLRTTPMVKSLESQPEAVRAMKLRTPRRPVVASTRTSLVEHQDSGETYCASAFLPNSVPVDRCVGTPHALDGGRRQMRTAPPTTGDSATPRSGPRNKPA